MAASPAKRPPPLKALAGSAPIHRLAMLTPSAPRVKAVADRATCTCAVPKCRLVTGVVAARAYRPQAAALEAAATAPRIAARASSAMAVCPVAVVHTVVPALCDSSLQYSCRVRLPHRGVRSAGQS